LRPCILLSNPTIQQSNNLAMFLSISPPNRRFQTGYTLHATHNNHLTMFLTL